MGNDQTTVEREFVEYESTGLQNKKIHQTQHQTNKLHKLQQQCKQNHLKKMKTDKVDCNKMTVIELKNELKIRRLPVSGNKETLLSRLLSLELVNEIDESHNHTIETTRHAKGDITESFKGGDVVKYGSKRPSSGVGTSSEDPPNKKKKIEVSPDEELLRHCKAGNLPEVGCLISYKSNEYVFCT